MIWWVDWWILHLYELSEELTGMTYTWMNDEMMIVCKIWSADGVNRGVGLTCQCRVCAGGEIGVMLVHAVMGWPVGVQINFSIYIPAISSNKTNPFLPSLRVIDQFILVLPSVNKGRHFANIHATSLHLFIIIEPLGHEKRKPCFAGTTDSTFRVGRFLIFFILSKIL